MKKYILAIFIICGLSVQAALADQGGSDAFGYMWTDSKGTVTIDYNWIDIKSSANQVYGASYDNEAPVGKALPFKVWFYGVAHDSLFISPNGWFSFKNPQGNSYPANDTLPSASAPDSIVAPYWDDLTGDSRYDDGIYYAVVGSAPNRKIVVQWESITAGALGVTSTLVFEAVIYERNNLIKFQYKTVDSDKNGGGEATIGIAADASDGLTYYYGDGTGFGPLTSNMAILFHNRRLVSGATAAISPLEAQAGSYTQFNYTFYDIDLSGAKGLGKLDRFAIKVPFSTVPSVSAVYLNGDAAYIQNSQTAPSDPGYAVWYYDSTKDSLIVLTSYFDVPDSVRIVFGQSMPTSLSQNNAYASTFDARLDQSAAGQSSDGGFAVNVVAGNVAYYTFNPSADQTISAGGSINYTITARDQYGNGVVNSQSVTVSTPGSSTATVSPSSNLTFANDSTLSFSVSDNTAGSFTVQVSNDNDSNINGESGLVTVQATTADHFVKLSSESAITVGTDRLLQVRLEDAYGNDLSGESVTFTRVRGSGTFSNGLASISVTTDANGVAQATYTASTSVGYVSDSIDVATGTVRTEYVLPLQADAVTHYTFDPSGDQTISAGGSINYTITARDQYGNGVANSQSVTVSTPGSSTATVSPSNNLSFANDSTLSFTVSDTVSGSFAVRVANDANTDINGESGLVTVNTGALSYVLIRSEANNGGTEVGDLNLTTDDVYTFYAAGYDSYGNYISDTDVTWSSTGSLETINATGSKFTFNPSQAGGSGQIVATPSGGATADQTGTISVSVGSLAELRIQTQNTAGQSTLSDTSITADENLTLYAVGYDADGNYIGLTAANWTLNTLSGSLSPANPTTSVTFTPDLTGSGSISAQADANSQIGDQTGSITVTAGAVNYVLIRDEANGGGQEVGDVTMTAGQTLTLYAAGYDSKNNFAGNVNVDWSVTGTLSGLSADHTNTYVVTLSPTSPGSGTVQTSNSNGWSDDATGTIDVQNAGLARIEIRTAAGGNGVALDDSAATAGDAWTLYAAGYDTYGNYLQDVAVKWSATGDSIGYFANSDSSASNTFHFTVVHSGKFMISKNNGGSTLTDASGIIKVSPGAPTSMVYVSSNNFTGSAGSKISDSLAVKVLDAFNNVVPGVTVDWKAQDPTANLTPTTDLTDNLGISRSKWKLRDTIGKDSAYAVVQVIPDSLKFTANVLESKANSLARWNDASNDSARTGTVKTQIAQPFVLEVTDSLGNPVSDVPITFAVLNYPEGGGDFSFSPDASETTDQTGRATVYFIPGSKTGTYTITGYNDNLINSGTVFFSVKAEPAAVDHLTLLSTNNAQDTVGTVYGDSVRIKAEDAYGNGVSGVSVTWTPTSDGTVSNGTSTTNSSGQTATQWTLRTHTDKDTLIVSSNGLSSLYVTAKLIPDAPAIVLADSGDGRTGVAGNGQLIRARVTDHYGNAISGQKISFHPFNSDGYLSAYEVNSDAEGLAATTYTSPSNVDSSKVQAYVAGVDTTVFTVYAIRYQSASLSPALVDVNDTVAFTVNVTNAGKENVPLNTGQTTFSFANQLFNAALDSPAVLQPGMNHLKFAATQIPASVEAGNYTPRISFTGSGVYQGLRGSLNTDDGELSVQPVRILSITVPDPKQVPHGTSKENIRMKVRNSGNYTVTVDSVYLKFTPDYNFSQQRTAGPDSIKPGTDAVFEFTVTVPSSAPEDSITVDGQIFATARVTGDQIQDGAADQTDYFIVTQQADLQYVDFSPKTVSENQSVAFTFQIQNNGAYDVILDKDSTRLVFGTQTFYLTDNQTVSGNSVSTVSFAAQTVTLGAASSPYPGVLYAYGTENTMPVRDTLYTASNGDSLTVQSAAQLSIVSLTLNDTTTTQGNENDTLTVALHNNGQAAAVITTSDSVLLQYASEYTFTPMQSFPYTISGNSTANLRYLIKTAADAPLGMDTMRVEVGYQDQNSQSNYHVSDPNKFDAWNVLGRGQITILSVLTDYDSVSTGQDSILVTMRVRNDGHNSVQIDSIKLTFSNGSYDPTTVKRSVNKIINVGQSDTLQFHVTVETNSSVGTASINGQAYGHDTFSQALAQDAGADTTDSWLIVEAVNLAAGEFQPAQISSGQYISPWVIVTNSGQAVLSFDKERTILFIENQPSFYRKLVRPTYIPGGTTDTLFFAGDTASGPSGQYDVQLQVIGQENHSYYADTLNVANQLTIQSGADMAIDSVLAEADNISQGTDTTVVVTIKNNGEATLLVDTLYLSAYPDISQITPALPAEISGNGKQRFTLRFTVPADDPVGSKTLDAVARGRDQNLVNGGIDSTLADDHADVPDQWTVFTPADVQVASITSPDSVVHQGDASIPIHIALHNSGSAQALVTDVTLQQAIGLYDFHYPDFNFTLAGNGDTTITVLADVKSNSATGQDTITARVSFTDEYAQKSANNQSNSALNWRIVGGQPIVSVISVSAEPEKVSLGQSGINVKVRVKNTGDREADIDTLRLKFSNNSSSAYTQGTISPALGAIQPGVEVTYTVPVDVNQTANTGPDTLWAALDVHEPETGLSYSVEDSTINDSWQVQERPSIVIDKVEMSPGIASTGQQGILAKVYVNNEQGTYRADAQIDDVVLLMRNNGTPSNDQFTITRHNTPTLPIVLQNGKTLVFEFDVDVKSDAQSANYDAYARVESEDVNDGTVTQTITVNTPGSLQVQQVAQLTVDTLWVRPDTLSEFQDHGRLYVKYSNTGEAAAQVTAASVQFTPDNLDFNPILISDPLPYQVAGQTSDTLVYSLKMPDINLDTLTVQVDATVSGKDINSSQETTAQSSNSGRFLLESAASVEWVSTTPSSWSVDTAAVQFESVVLNHGQATVKLDTSQTTMQIRLVNSSTVVHQIKLDAQSTHIIASQPDSTHLLFHKEVLPIAAGEYELFLHLVGTTNDSVYDEDLYAGQFAFGDSIIVIKSVQIQTNDHVPQGADSIIVYMKVSNSEGPKTITPDLTKLIFYGPNKSDDRDAFVLNLHRLDTLTVLKKEDNNLLKFQFDITDNFPAENYTEIYGQIGLDNGDIVKVSNTFDQLYVQTLGSALYQANTLSPDSVVARQKVQFSVALIDTGTASVTLDAEQTYLQILHSSLGPIKLYAEYTIPGKDTAVVNFQKTQLPADLNPGYYDVALHIYGQTVGGSIFQKDTTLTAGLLVLKSGEVHVARIDIPALHVRKGQTDVPVTFRLHNQGQSPVYITEIIHHFKRIADEKDVSDNWVWTRGTAEDTVIAGQDSLQFTAYFNVSSDADTGWVMPRPLIGYYDQRTPDITKQSDSVEVDDSVRVIRPARLRIDSLKILASPLAPNAPYVNLGRDVPLAVTVSNTGEDTIATATIKFYREGTALPGEIIFNDIPPAPDSQRVGIYDWSADPLGPQQIKAKVFSAKDVIGGTVAIAQPLDDQEQIIVQQPSQIWPVLQITDPPGALDSVVSLDQTFTVQARVERQGNSPYGTGVLTLRLPSNYEFAQNPNDSLRTFDVNTNTVQWLVRPVNLSNGQNFDSLTVYLKEIPVDSNSAQAVQVVSRQAQLPVRVENKGMVQTQLTVVAPEGATDSTVSAGQTFTVRAAIRYVGPVAATSKKARLILPQGFAVKDSSTVDLPDGLDDQTAEWQVVAPATPSKNLMSIFADVLVNDANSGRTLVLRSAALPVRVQSPPEIVLANKITAPAGAKDFVVSSGQEVVLQTVVGNVGQAEFDTSGTLRLTAGGGIRFKHDRQSGQPNSTVNVIEHFRSGIYQDTLLIPATTGTGTVSLQILNNERPLDINSGLPAKVRRDSLGMAFLIVKRADLHLHFYQMPTLNDTLYRSTNQSFTITARVENNGSAGVTDGVWVKLDTLNSHLILLGNDSIRHKIEPNQSTQWLVKTPDQDYNTSIRILADPQHPALDENAHTVAFLTDSSAADTLNLAVKKVDNILVSATFVKNDADTLTVSTDQAPVVIKAQIVFHQLLDGDKKVVLNLPQGFTSLDTSLARIVTQQAAQLQWQVRAPADSKTWQKIVVAATARSKSIPGLNPVTVADTLTVRVVPKTQLSLTAKIVEPAGATDDSVSPGQLFKLQALIRNKDGAAPAQGSGTVVLRTGGYFSIVDQNGNPLSGDSAKTFTANVPVYWWVKVDDNATLSKLNVQPGMQFLRNRLLHAPNKLQSVGQAGSNDLQNNVLNVVVKSLPLDSNSGQPAFIQNSLYVKSLFITQKARVMITEISTDTLSTGQTYPLTIKAQLSDNIIEPFVKITLEDDYLGTVPASLPLDAEHKAVWNLQVPADYAASGREIVRFQLVGTDENSGQKVTDTRSDTLIIQQRAKLALSDPLILPLTVANSGLLSQGQEVQISLKPMYAPTKNSLPYARLKGQGTVALDTMLIAKQGFKLINSPLTHTFSDTGQVLTWTLKAPYANLTTNLTFKFDRLPLDANTQTPADVDKDLGKVSIPVRVRQKTITIKAEALAEQDTNLTRGQTNVPLFSFTVSNKEFSDPLHVRAVQLAFYATSENPDESNLLSPKALAVMFKSLQVMDYADFQTLAKKKGLAKTAVSYADLQVTDTTANPVTIPFAKVADIDAGQEKKLIIVGQFQDNVVNRVFRASLKQVVVYDFDPDKPLGTVDEQGQKLADSDQLTSKAFVLVSTDPKEAFGNYPNPFGRQYTYTNIAFLLEQASDVDIRIFTLTGDLVWSKKLSGLHRGFYDRLVRWDGKNDRGQTVLNGVYLGVIEIKPLTGGAVKRYITKIAYIK